jgi:deoxyribodipyrimidine photolyase-related protein
MKELKSISKKTNTKIVGHDTPMFMSKLSDLKDYYNKHKKHTHNQFYIWQRKRFNILMKGKKPLGGKWSFDTDNREPFPDNYKESYNPKPKKNKYINEAIRYVNKNFKDNVGSTDFYLPITYSEIRKHLMKFINQRYKCFGIYQDAVKDDIIFGCHSVISPYLNIGMLTPNYVIDKLVKLGRSRRIPISSIEGIVRQIVGWREYIRMFYMFNRVSLERGNHLKHRRKLKDYWFDIVEDNEGSQMNVIDDLINKAVQYGYLHHIERLMYIGNYMLINNIHPKDCYKWFMELFIDSYNWVMVPNVYGMSQYSAGKVMMTRPYFSSSSYIDRMSNYNKSKNVYPKIKLGKDEYEWFEVWDSLYYNFISQNVKEFSKNYAIARQVKHWKNKSRSEQLKLKRIANQYMKKY